MSAPNHDDDELVFADEADDELLFAPEELGESTRHAAPHAPWKVLIVDDEREIHDVTKLALDEVRFAGRAIEFLSAYSGLEARRLVCQHPDIALILLDVVMETEHAGLDLVRYVREELGNKFVRIILRTGQPGQAPEHDVIVEYDINDYKSKTELTHQRMFTMVYTSLSSYRDLMALKTNREGLRTIIEGSPSIFDLSSTEHFSRHVLEKLAELLYLGSNPGFASGFAVDCDELSGSAVVAGIGQFQDLVGKPLDGALVECGRLDEVLQKRHYVFDHTIFIGYVGNSRHDSLLYVRGEHPFTVPEPSLVELFCRNVAVAKENIALKKESEETQREIVYLLSEAIEKRSNETGNHVRRVGEYARLLARLAGLSSEEAEILQLAAPLHDAGKIAIPDAILNKPGAHTPEEAAIMRTHAEHGAELLRGYKRPVLRAAAIIAGQHHERWDGGGYPLGLAGSAIHIYGRIAALADVFDALGSDRCYKKAWALERIIAYLHDERARHFDPALVDLLLANLDRFLAIRNRYQDPLE